MWGFSGDLGAFKVLQISTGDLIDIKDPSHNMVSGANRKKKNIWANYLNLKEKTRKNTSM